MKRRQAVQRTAVQLIPILTIAAFLLGPRRASGEPFLDVYGGVAETQSASVTAEHRDCGGDALLFFLCSSWTKGTTKVDFETAGTFGMRAGYWFERVPWLGLAGDVSFFEAEGRDVRFKIVPVSLLLMLRLPLLATEEIPKGRLQPYFGMGPSLFYQEASVDFRPQVDKKVSLSSWGVGLDTRIGLAWQVHRRVALFTEYRFTYLPISMDNEGDSFSLHPATRHVDATLNTHHLLAGISFRF